MEDYSWGEIVKHILQRPATWSDGLRGLTAEYLACPPEFEDGLLHMKHINGQFGMLSISNVRDGAPFIIRSKVGGTIAFGDVSSLIANGWAVD